MLNELKRWKEQHKHSIDVGIDLTTKNSYVFANDDGTLRTYSGCRHIFDRFKKRNGLKNSGIHFHSLHHTFSNMLFELNENPKVIQQLLGHKDVKTTIGIYNSVNSDYVKEATDKLNEKIIENEKKREQAEQEQKEEQEKQKQLSDEEFDRKLAEMLREQEEHKRRRRKEILKCKSDKMWHSNIDFQKIHDKMQEKGWRNFNFSSTFCILKGDLI